MLLAYLKLALIVRTHLLTYATSATDDSHSLKNMMTGSCTLIISSQSSHIATWLCDARECSMKSTIVKPLSVRTSAQPRTMTRDNLGDYYWSCAFCESDPVIGSACSCVFEAGSDREDTSSDACYVGDTRYSSSRLISRTYRPTFSITCKGHAVAVSSPRPSVSSKNDCVSSSMSHGSGAPVTFCWPPPGWLDRSV